MLIGEFTHTIDDKGRLSVPAKFRPRLKSGIVVTRGLDHCLFVYPQKTWAEFADKLANLPISGSKARAFTRLMLAGASEDKPDSQGRIMVPEYLRKYAGLKKHVVILGLVNRLEVWEEDARHTHRRKTEAASAEIAESMSESGV